MKISKKISMFFIMFLIICIVESESVSAKSTASIHSSFTNIESKIVAVIGTMDYPQLYTYSQVYDAQFSIAKGEKESMSTYRDTVVGGTVMITELNKLSNTPIQLYMKNKSVSALNNYYGKLFY